MGNRALIVTEKKDLAVYLHWNGGRDSVEPFLAYCKLKGYRAPENDCYGWARLCQVASNFFGGTLCIGIDRYENLKGAGDDNGEYIIRNWEIVDRVLPYDGFEEQMSYDFNEMLQAIDEEQPVKEQLGDYLKAEEVPTSSLQIGDLVYVTDYEKTPVVRTVVGFGSRFGKDNIPYVDKYDHDGDYSWNGNNYITSDTVRKATPIADALFDLSC